MLEENEKIIFTKKPLKNIKVSFVAESANFSQDCLGITFTDFEKIPPL